LLDCKAGDARLSLTVPIGVIGALGAIAALGGISQYYQCLLPFLHDFQSQGNQL